MGSFIKHVACEECGSSDGKAVYEDNSSHCFVCSHTVPSKEYKQENKSKASKVKPFSIVKNNKKDESMEKESNKIITDEQNAEVKAKTQIAAGGYRGIDDEVLKFYGCRTELDDEGSVYARYYPYTIDGKLSGYKVRKHPKTFGGNVGETGKQCDLYGSFRFPNGGKYVLVVEGEECAAASYQMFLEYSKSKGHDFVTAVVSLGQGVKSAKQVANNYEFLNKFDNIVLGMDSDDAGQAGIQDLVDVMPKGKVKIAKWTKYKDPNDYLIKDAGRQFIQDFYNAETYMPVGVLGSNSLYQEILNATGSKRLAFPPMLEELNTMLAGGIPLGHTVNLAASTSTGKTTILEMIVYDWIFNSPYKIGVVSLEADSAQYGENLLSRHLSKKIAIIKDENERQALLKSPEVAKAAKELFETPEGNPRFFLLVDRDGTVEQLQEIIEQMVIGSDCKIIVIDPLQDIFAGLGNEDQEKFMKWTKSMTKSHRCTFILVNHIRKSSEGSKDPAEGARITEQQIHGSSTIQKSASVNILLSRNKMAEDPIERNTTLVDCSKSRITGVTGPAGALYYDNETHTLHNFKEYFGQTFQEYKEERDNGKRGK